MRQRHSYNQNLVLHYDNHWNGFSVQSESGPLAVNYLKGIFETLSSAVHEYPRTCAIRFDLRIPTCWDFPDSAVISRFLASLKAKIQADSIRKSREGRRVHLCRMRYVWVKEQNESHHSHYHVCILLNRDAYFTLGKFKSGSDWWVGGVQKDYLEGRPNMSEKIVEAWSSALHCPDGPAYGLVHFPKNAVYKIDSNSSSYGQQFSDVFHRISYFAKVETKHYGNYLNSFGCSRG